MKTSLVPFALCCVIVSTNLLQSQCSDAGICSIGHRPPQNEVRLSLEYALGRSTKADDLTFHSFIAAGILPILEDSRLTVILPFNRQNGPLGSVSGIGDLTAIWTQKLASGSEHRLSMNLGAKIALADVNAGSLPQSYQSGLGTNDVLAGISYETGEWNFSFGYQLSRGRSENKINRLKRGDDLLVTAGYTTSFGEFVVDGEILAIKRVHKSNVLVPLALSVYSDIPKSDQGQINLMGRLSHSFTKSITLRGMVAVPLLARDINVDGLTRSFSVSIGVLYTL